MTESFPLPPIETPAPPTREWPVMTDLAPSGWLPRMRYQTVADLPAILRALTPEERQEIIDASGPAVRIDWEATANDALKQQRHLRDALSDIVTDAYDVDPAGKTTLELVRLIGCELDAQHRDAETFRQERDDLRSENARLFALAQEGIVSLTKERDDAMARFHRAADDRAALLGLRDAVATWRNPGSFPFGVLRAAFDALPPALRDGAASAPADLPIIPPGETAAHVPLSPADEFAAHSQGHMEDFAKKMKQIKVSTWAGETCPSPELLAKALAAKPIGTVLVPAGTWGDPSPAVEPTPKPPVQRLPPRRVEPLEDDDAEPVASTPPAVDDWLGRVREDAVYSVSDARWIPVTELLVIFPTVACAHAILEAFLLTRDKLHAAEAEISENDAKWDELDAICEPWRNPTLEGSLKAVRTMARMLTKLRALEADVERRERDAWRRAQESALEQTYEGPAATPYEPAPEVKP